MTDGFVQTALKVAVAQICKDQGFTESKKSALDLFTDVTKKFITEIALSAGASASLASRSETNVLDVIGALEEQQVDAKDLLHFYTRKSKKGTHMPFEQADSLPAVFPLQKQVVFCHQPRAAALAELSKKKSSMEDVDSIAMTRTTSTTSGDETKSENKGTDEAQTSLTRTVSDVENNTHIPLFLPCYPGPHTYQQTAVVSSIKKDRVAVKRERVEENRQMERALVNLHKNTAKVHATSKKVGEKRVFPLANMQVEVNKDREREAMREGNDATADAQQAKKRKS